jgi:hypothetical protein
VNDSSITLLSTRSGIGHPPAAENDLQTSMIGGFLAQKMKIVVPSAATPNAHVKLVPNLLPNQVSLIFKELMADPARFELATSTF